MPSAYWITKDPYSASIAQITNSPNITTTSALIIAANPMRKGLILYNNSANSVYITFGPTANSSTLCTAIIPTFTQWTMMGVCVYTGAISGIRNAGTGFVVATELT